MVKTGVVPDLIISNPARAGRTSPDLGTQIPPQPDLDLGKNCLGITEQYA